MPMTAARFLTVVAGGTLVLGALLVGAPHRAEAQFMMPMTHMPLARGPLLHGPLMHDPMMHGPMMRAPVANGLVAVDRVHPHRLLGGRTVRIPSQRQVKLRGHAIDTETIANACGDGRRIRGGRCGGARQHGAIGTVSLPAANSGTGAQGAQRSGGGADNNAVPPGEQRFVHEVITEFKPNASPRAIAQLARRFNLTQVETQRFGLIDATFYRWRIGGRRTVPATVNGIAKQSVVAMVQPNYLFRTQDETAPGTAVLHGDPGQYVLNKLEVEQAHQLATGRNVLLAIIDSAIDGGHPDLAHSIVKNFDALGGKADPQLHGTDMAGAIAAHGKLLGIAPEVRLLAARAFDNTPSKARGTSFDIFKSLQWAADNGARVINMSFAGPADQSLHRMLAAAYAKDIVLIAAAGNDGAEAVAAYPAADPDVIAVTATDADDQPFKLANRGKHIAVAAPGVDILAVAPGAAYDTTTGTSVAAAHVSGIAALLLQRDPALKAAQIRAIVSATAKPVGAANQRDAFGAGLVDAYRAVMAPELQAAGSAEAREQATR